MTTDLFSLDNLDRLSPRDAVRIESNRRNSVLGLAVARIAFFLSLVGIPEIFTGSMSQRLAALFEVMLSVIFWLSLSRVVRLDRDATSTRCGFMDLLARPIRRTPGPFLLALLVLLYAALLVRNSPASEMNQWAVIYPWLMLAFRFPPGEQTILHLALFAGGWLEASFLSQAGDVSVFVGMASVNAIALCIALFLGRRYRRAFLRRWEGARQQADDQLRMRKELAYARDLQLGMLPLRSPDLAGLDLSSFSLPAMEVGGDYYDFLDLPEERSLFVIADVAGHGFASALMISGIRSCLLMMKSETTDLGAAMLRLSRMVGLSSRKRTLVSLCMVQIDRATMSIRLCGAGHPPPLVYRAKEGAVEEIALDSLPLGSPLQKSYPERDSRLEAGDILLLYTDGFYESVNDQMESFGLERLKEEFQRAASGDTAKEVRDALIQALWSFRNGSRQLDDITMVIAKRPASEAVSQ